MIKKIAVIGAGVMGSAIAAHCANAGADVVLLDIVPQGAADDPSVLARSAVERLLKTRPAPLMLPAFAKRITPGNLEDDLALLEDADWIIEAVVERLDVKHALYKAVDDVRKPGSIISSNTSTIPLALLTQGQSAAFQADFLITHFFNPPRYMRLLELVAGPKTRAATLSSVRAYCAERLGKGVIVCNDKPGFIANRIGTFFVEVAIEQAALQGLSIDQADAICGAPMGMPKTGVFGLCDLVGIDLISYVGDSLRATLPNGDALHKIQKTPQIFQRLIADGQLGRKGKTGGFYKTIRDGDKRTIQAFDIQSATFRPRQKANDAGPGGRKTLKDFACSDSAAGRYAKTTLTHMLAYAAHLVPQVSQRIADIDTAMRLGYNWRWGPFELIDQLGVDWLIKACEAEGLNVPPFLSAASGKTFYRGSPGSQSYLDKTGTYQPAARDDRVLSLAAIKHSTSALARNDAASLWDLGSGVINLELTSKANALTQQSFDMVEAAMDLIDDKASTWKALVIYSDGSNFASGADLREFQRLVAQEKWSVIESFAQRGQSVLWRMRNADFPIVSAVAGAALGGGAEIVLHSNSVVAHAESVIGLVEASVGIIPAWGGCAALLERNMLKDGPETDPMRALMTTFLTIGGAHASTSAHDAKRLGFLRDEDEIIMNRDHLLTAAKAKALERVDTGTEGQAAPLLLPASSARSALLQKASEMEQDGTLTAHDLIVLKELASVLTGGDTAMSGPLKSDDILPLEIAAALKLFKTDGTRKRIDFMLEFRRPLRN